MQIFPLISRQPLWKKTTHLTSKQYPHTYASICAAARCWLCRRLLWVCVCVFYFLLRDNWAAMTAAFPPNGKGQINLPVLMSANGTGPLLPPPCGECRWRSEDVKLWMPCSLCRFRLILVLLSFWTSEGSRSLLQRWHGNTCAFVGSGFRSVSPDVTCTSRSAGLKSGRLSLY